MRGLQRPMQIALLSVHIHTSKYGDVAGDISSAITAVESALGGPAQADTLGQSDRTRPWGGPPGDRRDRPWPGPGTAPRQPAPNRGGVQLPPRRAARCRQPGQVTERPATHIATCIAGAGTACTSTLASAASGASPGPESPGAADESLTCLFADCCAPTVTHRKTRHCISRQDVALTALAAEWRVTGPGVWPWDSAKSEALLAALADTLPALAGNALVTAVRGAGTPVAFRLLLQAQAATVSTCAGPQESCACSVLRNVLRLQGA